MPLRVQPHQAALEDEAEHDQQEYRQQRADHQDHCYCPEARRVASRSSAPCRMKIAACSSITSARLARLTSMPISSRSTAAVESRSSHSPMAKRGQLREIAGERPGRLRARAFAAVHVDGQPEHEADDVALSGEREQPRRIGLERLARDGLDAGREPAIGIGDGDADGLGAEIEADQRATFRPERGGVDERENGGGHGVRITRGAAVRQSGYFQSLLASGGEGARRRPWSALRRCAGSGELHNPDVCQVIDQALNAVLD